MPTRFSGRDLLEAGAAAVLLGGVGVAALLGGALLGGTGVEGAPAAATTSRAASSSLPQGKPKQNKTDPDVVYIPTPQKVVDAMLEAAAVQQGETVYDLGCGDGRIVITAAKSFGAKGIGVDIDPLRIKQSNENAVKAGVTDRVKFLQADLFTMDFRDADVVALYLLPQLNVKLRPKLLSELKPGTRVLSHAFHMGDWKPDRTIWSEQRRVFYWVIPADASGEWTVTGAAGSPMTLKLTQKYQELSGSLVGADGKETPVAGAAMAGDRISFTVAGAALGRSESAVKLTGRVSGDSITGGDGEKWTATRRKKA